MKLRVVSVTPEMASEWLKNNGKNRNLSIKHVRRLAAIMSAGKWSLNGQTISFDEMGRLLDGQHRLSAVVMSGVTVDMAIATDVIDDRAFQTYDAVQLKRGANQIACMMNKGHLKNATKVTSAARVILAWESSTSYQDFISYFTGYNSLHDQLPEDIAAKAVEISEEFNETFDSLGEFVQKGQLRSGLVAILMILNRMNPVATSSFVYKLRTGLFNDSNDPVYHLRERMLRTRGSNELVNEKKRLVTLVHLTVKAWNAHVKDRKIPLLRFSEGQNESIPVPFGSPKR